MLPVQLRQDVRRGILRRGGALTPLPLPPRLSPPRRPRLHALPQDRTDSEDGDARGAVVCDGGVGCLAGHQAQRPLHRPRRHDVRQDALLRVSQRRRRRRAMQRSRGASCKRDVMHSNRDVTRWHDDRGAADSLTMN